MTNRQLPSGFSLVEILIIVLIIGILVAIAFPQLQKAMWRSRNMELKHYVKIIADAQVAYYLKNGTYAANFKDLDISLPFSAPGTVANTNIQPCNKRVPGTDSLRKKGNIIIFFNNSSSSMTTVISVIASYTTGPYKCVGIGKRVGVPHKSVPNDFCVEFGEPSFVKAGTFCQQVEKGSLKYTDEWGTRFYSWEP